MSEEFKEGMNEDRGMAEEHKGPQESASGMETPGGVDFTMKDTADERPSQPEQAAPVSPEQAAPGPAAGTGAPNYGNGDIMAEAAAANEQQTGSTQQSGSSTQQPDNAPQSKGDPAAAPTPENPVYAKSYKSEPKKEEWYEKEQKKNYDSYRFTSPVPPENNKKEKPKRPQGGIGKKLGTAAVWWQVWFFRLRIMWAARQSQKRI